MNKMNRQTITFLLTGSLALAMALNQHVHAKTSKDKEKKEAGRSTELIVDPNFNFDSSTKVTLDISVTNDLKRPMPDVMLKVYAVEDPKRLGKVKRRLKTTLLTVIRTDATGNAQRQVEIPQHYRDLKVEKMMMSRYPVQYIQLNGEDRVVVDL